MSKSTFKKPEPRKKKRKQVKWHDGLYIEIYELIKEGHSQKDIAELLKITIATLQRWIKERPALRDMIRKAKKHKGSLAKPDNFLDYIYDSLPPDVKQVWDELTEIDETDSSLRRMELLVDQPVKIRQQLFIHALVTSNYSTSAACKQVGITKRIYETWILSDSGFSRLVEEVLWHKKNFIESALMAKIAEGDTTAIIFASKTLNRDRGYESRSEVKHSGTVLNASIGLDELNLPIELRRQLLAAARERLNQQHAGEGMKLIEHKPAEDDDEAEDD